MASISALGVGSGMDLNGLLDQLQQAERQRLQPLTQQKQSHQAKISAYGKLESALSSFRDSVNALNKPEAFQAVKSSVSGSSITAAASSDAQQGSYSVNVTSIARAYSVATQGVAERDTNLGEGSVSFTLGSGDSFSVNVDAGNSSLEAIRDAINAEDSGVRASIVNDGSGTPYRLAFTSTETGTDAAISDIQFGGDLAAGMSVDNTTEITASNASLTINGIGVTSQTNRVEGAIQGVTLDLEQEGSSTLVVERDIESAREAVTNFVESYNSLQSSIREMTFFGGDASSSGQLLGDSAMRRVESELRTALTSGLDGQTFRTLSDIGVSRQLDGSLEVDDAKLDNILATQPDDLMNFFTGEAGNPGMSGLIGDSLDRLLHSSGPIASATESLNSMIGRLDQRYEQMERSIDNTIERYRTQFAQLDSMIANMNSTSSYLMQQFDAMNAQLGR